MLFWASVYCRLRLSESRSLTNHVGILV